MSITTEEESQRRSEAWRRQQRREMEKSGDGCGWAAVVLEWSTRMSGELVRSVLVHTWVVNVLAGEGRREGHQSPARVAIGCAKKRIRHGALSLMLARERKVDEVVRERSCCLGLDSSTGASKSELEHRKRGRLTGGGVDNK